MSENSMFENTEAYSGFAAPDIKPIQSFFEEKLGVKTSVLDEESGLLQLELAGDRNTLVYTKPDHEPANYTILNFVVEDVEAAVDELTSREVEFDHYDGFDQDDKGISRDGDFAIAWFKDPAGNILAVHTPA